MDLSQRKAQPEGPGSPEKGGGGSHTLAGLEKEEFQRLKMPPIEGLQPFQDKQRKVSIEADQQAGRKPEVTRKMSTVVGQPEEVVGHIVGGVAAMVHHSLHLDKHTHHLPEELRISRGHVTEECFAAIVRVASASPATLLKILPTYHPKIRSKSWAWCDSGDGIRGGHKIRVQVRESDLRAMKDFELFPNHGRLIVLSGEDHICELPYVAYSIVSADNKGPPGFIFCLAPSGEKFPVDATGIMPGVKRLFFREQLEADRAADIAEQARLVLLDAEVAVEEKIRKAFLKKREQEERLRTLAANARQPMDSGKLSSQRPEGEYVVWKQLRFFGTPPPPSKHATVHLYKRVIKIARNDADLEEDQDDADGDAVIAVAVVALEVWNRAFTVRWTIDLQCYNAANNAKFPQAKVGVVLMEWTELHISDPARAPAERDAPTLVYDGLRTILYGGKSRGGEYKMYFSDMWIFDYTANKWSPFEKGVKVYYHHELHKITKDIEGRQPSQRSSPCVLLQDTSIIIAGGSSRARKLNDVHRLDYRAMSWSQMLKPGTKYKGEEEVEIMKGEMPPRGFAMKNLVGGNHIYAPLLSDGQIFEFCLYSKTWRRLQVQGYVPWKSCKLLVADEKMMVRFTSIDFEAPFTSAPVGDGTSRTARLGSAVREPTAASERAPGGTRFSTGDSRRDSEDRSRNQSRSGSSSRPGSAGPASGEGFPAVETAEAWRVYAKVNPYDFRDDAEKQWMLQVGQVSQFRAVPSLGDAPGHWVGHSVTASILEAHPDRPLSCQYVWGGCRTGGVPSKKCTPPIQEQVIGKTVSARLGMRVYQRAQKLWGGSTDASNSPIRAVFAASPATKTAVIRVGAGTITELDSIALPAWFSKGKDGSQTRGLSAKVLWDADGIETDENTGAVKRFQLAVYWDPNVYSARDDDNITNELFKLEVFGNSEQRSQMRGFEASAFKTGGTNVELLQQVLGGRIIIDQAELARLQAQRRAKTVNAVVSPIAGISPGGKVSAMGSPIAAAAGKAVW